MLIGTPSRLVWNGQRMTPRPLFSWVAAKPVPLTISHSATLIGACVATLIDDVLKKGVYHGHVGEDHGDERLAYGPIT